jgi:hypothetical protein
MQQLTKFLSNYTNMIADELKDYIKLMIINGVYKFNEKLMIDLKSEKKYSNDDVLLEEYKNNLITLKDKFIKDSIYEYERQFRGVFFIEITLTQLFIEIADEFDKVIEEASCSFKNSIRNLKQYYDNQ